MDKNTIFMQGTNGQAVLLVHGLTGAPAEMSFIAKRLNKKGYTVYCPVLDGHCRGKDSLLATGWQDWYGSVDHAWQYLKQHHDVIYAAGICAGGSLALHLAAERPQALKAVALYSITFRYDGWNIPHTSIFLSLFPLLADMWPFRHGRFSEKHPYGIKDDRLREMMLRSSGMEDCLPFFPYPILRRMYQLNDTVRAELPAITTPTLIVHARNDDVSHLRNAHIVKRAIGGEHHLHVLENSYHMVHIDQERQAVADLTADYFSNYRAADQKMTSVA